MESRVAEAGNTSPALRSIADVLLPFALSTKLWRLGVFLDVRDVYWGGNLGGAERSVVSRALSMSARLSGCADPQYVMSVAQLHGAMLDACADVSTPRGFRSRELAIGGELLAHPGSIALQCRDIVRAVTAQSTRTPASAALIGGLCLAITHPFANGNGRCARAFTWLAGRRNARVSMTPYLIALHMQGGQRLWGVVFAEAMGGNDGPFWRHLATAIVLGNRLVRDIESCTEHLSTQERDHIAAWDVGDMSIVLQSVARPICTEPNVRQADRLLAEKLLNKVNKISGSLYTRF
jgi:hypothetical protein